MPAPAAFLSGFGIHKGMVVEGYTLQDVAIEHVTISRNHEYQYPMKLTFVGGSNAQGLLMALWSSVAMKRIINSEYGNPYECNFGTPSITSSTGNTVIISSVGHSERVYHVAATGK